MRSISLRSSRYGVIAVCMALASCKESDTQSRLWEVERERVKTSQKIELLRFRLDSTRQRADEEADAILARLALDERKITELRSRIAEIEASPTPVADTRGEELRRRRDSWQGRKLDQLKLADGRVYEDVTIVSIGDSGMRIRHAHGSARFGAAAFEKQRSEEFGLDAELEAESRKAESVRLAAYETEMEKAAGQRKAASAVVKRDPVVASAHPTRDASWIAENTRIAREAASRPLAQPARTFGTGSIYRYGYRYRSGYNRYYSPGRSVRYYNVDRMDRVVPPTYCPSGRHRSLRTEVLGQ